MAKRVRPNHAGRNVKSEEKIKLWVRAGGRCEFPGCNKYLLEDELTAQPVTLEDLAHLAGQSTAGPRGRSEVPMHNRNLASNLMLLCSEHHSKLYDRRLLLAEYTEERVREDKLLHENRIRTQTELGPECATIVICMFGRVRGCTTAISREEMRKAVFKKDRRYPHFLGTSYSIDIDLSGLPAETDPGYWDAGRARIDELFDTQVIPAMKHHGLKHRSVFAFARIPFLFHLGYRLADKSPASIFQRHRGHADEWVWPSEASRLSFQSSSLKTGRDKTKVAIAISASGKMQPDAISGCLGDGFTIYEIAPVDEPSGTNLVRSAADVEAFAAVYRMLLRHIEGEHPSARSVSLFPAVPIAVAVSCGMAVLPDVTPPLRLYDKTAAGYEFALEIGPKGGV